MNQWTIGKRLFTAFLVVAAITLLLGLVGYYGAVKSNEAIAQIGQHSLPGVESLLIMADAQSTVDSAENALLSREIDLKARLEKYATFTDALNRAAEAWQVYEPLPQTAEEAATWKKFVPAWQAWKKDHQRFVDLSQEYDRTVAAQHKGAELYGNMANQALVINMESFQKAKRLLDQIVEIYRAKTDNAQATYTKVDLLTIHALLTIKEAQTGVDAAENALLDRSGNLADRKASYDRMAAAWQRIAAARKVYEPLEQTPEEAQLWKEFVPLWDQWKADDETLVTLSKSYDTTVEDYFRSNELYKKMNELGLVQEGVTFDAAAALLGKLVEINKTVAAATTQTSSSLASGLKRFSLIAMIVGVLLALVLGFLISRGITKVLKVISASLADGAEQTVAAAAQVSSSSQSLAEGASEQAASLQETSSSLEEMASMTKRNAENARQANELAKQAREAADKGVGDMQTMADAMEAIKVSSADIAKIIKTIDEIAFQTNILALNAAVEAARAGEAGMGFAVVADEVRNLAQRCAQAAKETSSKIEGAIIKTGQGVAISSKVAATLNEIVTKARQVDELVTEVAGASREQTAGITQVNVAVSQMDKVTQSNAANAEESAAAAEELNAQAEMLKQSVTELLGLVGGHSGSAARIPAAKRLAPTRSNGNGNGHSPAASRRSEIPMAGDFKDF